MKNILKIKGIIVLSILLLVGACTNDFEDINTDPNVPVVAPASNILAHALREVSDNFWDDWFSMNNTGSYAGQLTKIQYIDEARYDERASIVNARWQILYNNLLDLKKVKEMSRADGNTNMLAVALTFESFLWQIGTDTWGAIPYLEALQAEDGISNPAYTDQNVIYDHIVDSLALAADLFTQGAFDDLGAGDILYNGSVSGWQKFCNSLRLRVAIRMSNVDAATAGTILSTVLGDPTNYPIIASNADNAQLAWPGAAPYKEPWAENYSDGRDDHGMCNVLVNKLEDLNDPRLGVIAKENDDEVYLGIDPGAKDGSFKVAEVSRIGDYYRGNIAGFTFFLRYPEVCFIKAEAMARGLVSGGAAGAITAYEDGVEASMIEHSIEGNAGEAYGAEITAADITAYLAQSSVAFNGTAADISKVYIQKWISLFKQSHESWAEVRRTDVPVIAAAPGSDYSANHNRQPFRWLYPVDEQNLNSANLAPHLANVTDGFWGQQMWWDTRTGVN